MTYSLTPTVTRSLAAPLGPGLDRYVKAIKPSLDEDQFGETALRVWVLLDDRTPDVMSKRGSALIEKIRDAVRRRAAELVPELWPYVSFRLASELPAR